MASDDFDFLFASDDDKIPDILAPNPAPLSEVDPTSDIGAFLLSDSIPEPIIEMNGTDPGVVKRGMPQNFPMDPIRRFISESASEEPQTTSANTDARRLERIEKKLDLILAYFREEDQEPEPEPEPAAAAPKSPRTRKAK